MRTLEEECLQEVSTCPSLLYLVRQGLLTLFILKKQKIYKQTNKYLPLLEHIQILIMVDAGLAVHSPSAELMTLVDVDHLADFDQVVAFLAANLDKVIAEVHGFDKLLIDNGKTQLNCPPAPEDGDSHGAELVRTLSEMQGADGVMLRREFKVHDMGVDAENPGKHKVEIREDIVGGPQGFAENIRVVSIIRE
jgi:hypothetical protein